MIARLTRDLLRNFQHKVLVFDPFLSDEEAAEWDVTKVTLDEIFEQSDVVSVHTPWLKETEGMIQGSHLARMKEGGTFINTSRGAVVDEIGLTEVLQERKDLFAILDVTYPEPPIEGSLLYELPNIILTPHIAGSMHQECRRMGRLMYDELLRFENGEPLKYQIDRKKSLIMA